MYKSCIKFYWFIDWMCLQKWIFPTPISVWVWNMEFKNIIYKNTCSKKLSNITRHTLWIIVAFNILYLQSLFSAVIISNPILSLLCLGDLTNAIHLLQYKLSLWYLFCIAFLPWFSLYLFKWKMYSALCILIAWKI